MNTQNTLINKAMKTNPRIKFFCRSFDLRLYRLSKGLYESLGFPCVRLADQTADGYFHTMLQDTDCDIAINVDEDCFLTNTDAVFALVDYAVENNIANIGCPDGGGWVPRGLEKRKAFRAMLTFAKVQHLLSEYRWTIYWIYFKKVIATSISDYVKSW